MANPFEKRATEYLRDDEAFLAVVTPEPLETFLQRPAEEGKLYDRLVMVIGTPGSGKTTLARLFQFSTLQTLLRNTELDIYKPLIDALTKCAAIVDQQPTLVGGRLSLEAEYRDIWELPYPESLKTGLMIALLQARAVLTWIRNIQATGVQLDAVEIAPRSDAEASLATIGGTEGFGLLQRAREVELAIYRISAALLPPEVPEIDGDATAAYRPFDVIESFRITDREKNLEVRPLIIFDDAQWLHPDQFAALRRWLSQRELKVARWIITRLDTLNPSEIFVDRTQESGFKQSREITEIWLQFNDDRSRQRRAFRKIAKDMARRYLGQMEVFSRRGVKSLEGFLSTVPETIPPGKRQTLSQRTDSLQSRLGVSAERRKRLENEIDNYLKNGEENCGDLRLALLAVLLERYARRTPQLELFEERPADAEPNRPIIVDSGAADGARIHLLHQYDRPYYYGIDTLCDASSENAEQFLQLAARLVSQAETQLIRDRSAMLNSALQNKLLREQAREIVSQWVFPQHTLVRRLANGIAAECLARSLEGNAPLGGGAIAFGIPQQDFDAIPERHQLLASVLRFGVGNNAFVLVPNHSTKNQTWCLIELGGVLLLSHGLTLKRGGFLERRVTDLNRYLSEE